MKLSKTLMKRILLLCIITISVFSLLLVFNFDFRNLTKTQNSFASLPADTNILFQKDKNSFGLPVLLKIPAININAPFEYVGLTSDGAMDVPKGPADVGWFNLGPRPGENGSAVIAGHSGWKNGVSASFDNLYKLKKGDKIYVEDRKGIITTFVVRESKKYNPSADASNVFISNDGKSHLNLITCTGIWNKIWKSHSDRLVVFTDKE